MGTSLTTSGISEPQGEINQWSQEDLGEFIVRPSGFAIRVCVHRISQQFTAD